jgi:hypothetical protein
MNVNSTEVVIARFNEDISWIKNINSNIKKTIYNKGSDYLIDTKQLPNIGRESDTFLRHILENYSRLSEYNIFLQGNPFFHYRNILNFINYDSSNQTIIFLSDRIETDDINGRPNHPGLKIGEVLENIGVSYLNDEKFTFSTGAQYRIHKSLILNKSFEWWENLYDVHNRYLSEPGINGSPWIFERIWPKIWAYSS